MGSRMPSFMHEALVLLLQKRPSLLFDLLREALGVALPVDAVLSLGSETLRTLVPIELRADAVLVLEDATTKVAIIVEAQASKDPGKRLVWPSYVALTYRNLGCTTLLVVLTVDPELADWCAEPIELAPGFVLRPLVIGPAVLPRITDLELACENVELTILSTLAHVRPETSPDAAAELAFAAIHAILTGRSVDEDTRADYADIVLGTLNAQARSLLEKLMSQGNYHSDFAREYFAKGEARGEARGQARGKADALLDFLAARGIAVDPSFVARIQACTDVDLLTVWIRRAATASTVADVFDA